MRQYPRQSYPQGHVNRSVIIDSYLKKDYIDFSIHPTKLTIGGAGKTRLPETSLSRTVTVAEVTLPNIALEGSLGPRVIENVSCHSMSGL